MQGIVGYLFLLKNMKNKPKNSRFAAMFLYSLLTLGLVASVVKPLFAEAAIKEAGKPVEATNPVLEAVLSESREGKLMALWQMPEPDKVLAAVITVYTSSRAETDDDPFTAASGKHVYDGMVANNCLKFGTKIKFPALYGDKEFTVDDRMNARYGCNRFDIWLNTSRQEARKFGVKRVAAEVFYVKSLAKRTLEDTKVAQAR